jgi:hypothetical protein
LADGTSFPANLLDLAVHLPRLFDECIALFACRSFPNQLSELAHFTAPRPQLLLEASELLLQSPTFIPCKALDLILILRQSRTGGCKDGCDDQERERGSDGESQNSGSSLHDGFSSGFNVDL